MGLFSEIRTKVLEKIGNAEPIKSEELHNRDGAIALGVLLFTVAQADDKFHPEEYDAVMQALSSSGRVPQEEWPAVLQAVEVASQERIDLYTFAREAAAGLAYADKVFILEQLFYVALADHDLDPDEEVIIRKVANVIQVEHEDFIEAKLKVKQQLGIKTPGL